MENEKNTIAKPLSIVLTEAEQNIANVINETQLSPILLEPIIKSIYNEVLTLKAQQIEKDKQEYEASLKDDNKE